MLDYYTTYYCESESDKIPHMLSYYITLELKDGFSTENEPL